MYPQKSHEKANVSSSRLIFLLYMNIKFWVFTRMTNINKKQTYNQMESDETDGKITDEDLV